MRNVRRVHGHQRCVLRTGEELVRHVCLHLVFLGRSMRTYSAAFACRGLLRLAEVLAPSIRLGTLWGAREERERERKGSVVVAVAMGIVPTGSRLVLSPPARREACGCGRAVACSTWRSFSSSSRAQKRSVANAARSWPCNAAPTLLERCRCRCRPGPPAVCPPPPPPMLCCTMRCIIGRG